MASSSSEVYEGEFKDDKKHGKGRAKLKASSTCRTKAWKDGREGDATVDVADVLVSTRKAIVEVQAILYDVDRIERQATQAREEIEKWVVHGGWVSLVSEFCVFIGLSNVV